MMGGAKAHYDGIVAFSQTDFTADFGGIDIPMLVMHGKDDQITPYTAAGSLSARLLRHDRLRTYKSFPHGMPASHAGEPCRHDQCRSLAVHRELTADCRFKVPPRPERNDDGV